jgi:thiol:disulfide interchange protein DsbA
LWHILPIILIKKLENYFMKVLHPNLAKAFRTGVLVLIATALMACQGETSAQTVDESKFTPVASAITVSTGDKIEVAELFWFGCGHCFALEPHVKKWKANMPANVTFVKVPAIFSKRWEFHGQAFYTMEALAVPEKAYDKFFHSIHIKRNHINSIGALVAFLEPFGKSKEDVEAAFGSFAVDSKMRNAKKITIASGARGVPAIVVDGKYLTNQTLSGGTEKLFGVVDQLVAKAASER